MRQTHVNPPRFRFDLGAPPELFLGILGVTGATAYFGLLDAASAKQSDIVFVSSAAGAVG